MPTRSRTISRRTRNGTRTRTRTRTRTATATGRTRRTMKKKPRTVQFLTLKEKIGRLLYKMERDNSLAAFYHLTEEQKTKIKSNPDFLLPLMVIFPDKLDEIVTRCMEHSMTEKYTFMLLAIKRTPELMLYASYELCDNMRFVMDAYYINPKSILYLPQEVYESVPRLQELYDEQIALYPPANRTVIQAPIGEFEEYSAADYFENEPVPPNSTTLPQ